MPEPSYGTTVPSLITIRRPIISTLGEWRIDPSSTCIVVGEMPRRGFPVKWLTVEARYLAH
jgi:hypothetical protein